MSCGRSYDSTCSRARSRRLDASAAHPHHHHRNFAATSRERLPTTYPSNVRARLRCRPCRQDLVSLPPQGSRTLPTEVIMNRIKLSLFAALLAGASLTACTGSDDTAGSTGYLSAITGEACEPDPATLQRHGQS